MEPPPGTKAKVFYVHRGDEGAELASLYFQELAPSPDGGLVTLSRVEDITRIEDITLATDAIATTS